MGHSKASQQRLQVLERQCQALELRRRGLRYEQIAAELGISVAAAWRHVMRAYQRALKYNDELAEFNRKLDLERLDAALAAIWPHVQAGKAWAITRMLGILERRARLLGLDMTARQEIDIGDVLARVMERLTDPNSTADN